MNPLKLFISGTALVMAFGLGICSQNHVKTDREFWQESAQYNNKQASKWKHRTELLEDAFGIGTVQNPAEGL